MQVKNAAKKIMPFANMFALKLRCRNLFMEKLSKFNAL